MLYMDPVSQILEANIQQAREINTILVKNEEQLNGIENSNMEINNTNTQSSYIIDSFYNLFYKFRWVWSKLSNKSEKSNINPEIVKSSELNQISELRELSNQMNQLLEDQNTKLSQIHEDTDFNETNLKKNHNKIKNLL